MLTSKKAIISDLLNNLKICVREKFQKNPSIIYIKSSELNISDPSGIEFNVKIMESLN